METAINTYKNNLLSINESNIRSDREAELLNIIKSVIKERDYLEKESDYFREKSDDLKKQLEESRELMNDIVCKYLPYMISDAIYEKFNVRLSSHAIVNTAIENGLFENQFLVLRVPRKRDSNDKFATTVLFSNLGVSFLFPFLIEKYTINPNAGADNLEKSIKDMEEGRIEYL